jgi:hypothetical protein
MIGEALSSWESTTNGETQWLSARGAHKITEAYVDKPRWANEMALLDWIREARCFRGIEFCGGLASSCSHRKEGATEPVKPTMVPASDSLGPVVRWYYVLRSDGAILSSSAWPQATDTYDRKRSGYKVYGTITEATLDKYGVTLMEAFQRVVNKQAKRAGVEAHFATA